MTTVVHRNCRKENNGKQTIYLFKSCSKAAIRAKVTAFLTMAFVRQRMYH